ncbi:RNA-binding protein 5 [Trichoplax sp. H2]|nr:RNA-binding protein 5 [Trichoplax sp. H2]|eukprot:RDD43191.1 RNA-binding protein 5 [Trichoplax sp. H2]
MESDWRYSEYSDFRDYPPPDNQERYRRNNEDFYRQQGRRSQDKQYFSNERDNYYCDESNRRNYNESSRARSPSPRYYERRFDRQRLSPRVSRYRSRSPDYTRRRDRRRSRSPPDYSNRSDMGYSRRDERVDNKRRYTRPEYDDNSKDNRKDETDRGSYDDERQSRRNRDGNNRDHREEPNRVIVIRNLAYKVDEKHISKIIEDHFDQQHVLKDVRLIRNKETGESRGFAFVEFIELKNAVAWMDDSRRMVRIQGQNAYLEYSKPRDWTCSKCGHFNFKIRRVCMMCKATRPELESRSNESKLDGGDDVSSKPTNVLIVRGLDVITREESVLQSLKQIDATRVDGIKIMKDELTNTSRGFCFVRLPSIKIAIAIAETISKLEYPFKIDNKEVVISYGRADAFESTAKKNLAAAAIAAAAWSVTAQPSSSSASNSTEQTVSSGNKQEASSYESTSQQDTTDNAQYTYDEKTGYYYYPSTGLYYDPNSQYFYNSTTGQYLYWSSETNSYVPVSNTGDTKDTASKAGGDAEMEKDKSSKIKISFSAKKVMKDMERWAKTSTTFKVQQPDEASAKKSKGFVPIGSNQPEASTHNQTVQAIFANIASTAKDNLASQEEVHKADDIDIESRGAVTYGSSASLDLPMLDSVVVTPESLLDLNRFACLLCRRQFSSKDTLMKHVELSGLHKTNLKAHNAKLENQELLYRDRAKERRQLYGQPDKVKEGPGRKSRQQNITKYEQPTKHGLTGSNVGNKMLKAMGWSEGEGLGRANQGITAPISAQVRSATAGLGADCSDYGVSAGDSYQEALKKLSRKRYDTLDD